MFIHRHISHGRAKKEIIMLILAVFAGVFVAVRIVISAFESLRQLPQTNDDWCWY